MNDDGTNVKKLTDGDGVDSWPAWSPDGKRLAFVSSRSGNNDIFLVQADGTNVRNLTKHAAQDTSPAWTPDGKKVTFVSTRGGGSDVYLIAAD